MAGTVRHICMAVHQLLLSLPMQHVQHSARHPCSSRLGPHLAPMMRSSDALLLIRDCTLKLQRQKRPVIIIGH